MSGVIPFLWFATEAEEAARYYVDIFPGAVLGDIQRFPANSRGPEGSVMTASFTLGGQQLVALNGNTRFGFSPAMSLLYQCQNREEADRVAGRLSAGGEKQPGGWLRDKFGVSWQVHVAS
jgi:predicted 3-demethylubiquinone-9 3-methyltransferase (glyoxalase superfamily)